MQVYTAPQLIEISEIDASDRLRPIDMDWAQAIAASMASKGLLHAVEVCRLPGQSGYKLVIGGHRLAAAKILGWVNIPASIGSADRDERRAREIEENVFRHDLAPIDRAAFVAELYSIEKAKAGLSAHADGRSHSAKIRWQKALSDDAADATVMMTGAYSLQAQVAAKIGLSADHMRRDLLLFKRLSPSIADRARKLPIGTNATALRALAKMEPTDQIRAVTLMEGGAKDINAAQAMMRGAPVVDAAKKRLKTFQDTFNRMGRAEQMEALRVLSNVLPKGVDLYFYKNLDERFAKENALVAADRPAAVAAPVTDRPTNVVDLEDIIRGAAE